MTTPRQRRARVLNKDLIGCEAILLRDITTGMARLPLGARVRIKATHRGEFTLELAKPCDACGAYWMAQKVSRDAFRVLPPATPIPSGGVLRG